MFVNLAGIVRGDLTHIVDQQAGDLHPGGHEALQVALRHAEFLETGGNLEMLYDLVQLVDDPGALFFHRFAAAAVMGGKVPQSVSGERAARLGAWAEQSKKAYITSCVGKEFDAVMESVKRPMILSGSFSAPLSASARKHTVYHAVTENFLHCELLSTAQNAPEPGSKIRVRIVGIVEAGAVKGGEYDVRAEFV